MRDFLSKVLKDSAGTPSSFRVAWFFFVMMIIATWSYSSVRGGELLPIPLDAATIIGLFGSSALKTYAEAYRKQP